MRAPLPPSYLLAAQLLASAPVLASAPGLAPEAPLFEVLPSTRRITCLAPRGTRVLAGTTGGLVEWNPDTDTRRNLLPGVPVRDLARGPTTPGGPPVTVVASDGGAYRLDARGLVPLDPEPTQSALVEPFRITTGHPAGKVRVHRDRAPEELQVPTRAPIHGLVRDRGELVVASVEGIWRLRDGRFRAEPLPGDSLDRSVTRLESLDGRLLAGTAAGLFESPEPGVWRALASIERPFVTDLAPSDHGPLLATAGDGALKLGPRGLVPLPGSRPEGWIAPGVAPPDLGHASAILRHRGLVLVGTPDDGLWILGEPPRRAWSLEAEPPGTTITSLAHADHFGTLVVGTFEQGVGLLQKGAWRHFPEGRGHMPSSWVNHVSSDGKRVLVRFSGGQVYTQIERHRFRQLGAGDGWPKNWSSATGVSAGKQWVGTQNAFYVREDGRWTVHAPKPHLQDKLVLDVVLDGSVRWLATHRSGVLRWDESSGRWDQYTLGSGLADPWVTCLESFRGELWAGTFDGGLARRPLASTDPADWTPVRHDDPGSPLPSDGIQCMVASPDGLWIGTFRGLVWTDGTQWRCFGPEHGLPSPNILGLTLGGGSLWVGTDAGLARAHLEDLR